MDAGKAAADLFEALKEALGPKIDPGDYALGKTKVFMRTGLYKTVEQYRRLAFAAPTLQIQAAWRGYCARVGIKEMKELNKQLQDCLKDIGLDVGHDISSASVTSKLKRATLMEGSLVQL